MYLYIWSFPTPQAWKEVTQETMNFRYNTWAGNSLYQQGIEVPRQLFQRPKLCYCWQRGKNTFFPLPCGKSSTSNLMASNLNKDRRYTFPHRLAPHPPCLKQRLGTLSLFKISLYELFLSRSPFSYLVSLLPCLWSGSFLPQLIPRHSQFSEPLTTNHLRPWKPNRKPRSTINCKNQNVSATVNKQISEWQHTCDSMKQNSQTQNQVFETDQVHGIISG